MNWELWLMRHGAAEPFGSKPDAQRRLVERGRKDSAAQGEAMSNDGRSFNAIISSPLPRARETAVEVASSLNHASPIETDERLAMAIDLEEIVSVGREAAKQLAEEGTENPAVLLVGHNPSMGELKAVLSGNLEDYSFKKAAVCGFAVESRGAKLENCSLIAEYAKPKRDA